jgi:hypothetical protein
MFGFSGFLFLSAYGDGLASETLPPESVGKGNVTLSINTSPTGSTDKQVALQLYDSNTGQQIPDVTFLIEISKGGKNLFSHIFKEDQGTLLMTLVQINGSQTSVVEENKSVFGQIFGSNSDTVDILGPDFTAGLYKFHIEILSAYSYDPLPIPLKYDPKISIPEYDTHTINDNAYGHQTVKIIGYYDQIKNFQYDTEKKSINFVMPFDWSKDNINAVSVVHQEIQIPKTWGDFLVTKYDAYVNGMKLPDKAIIIDDYSSDDRIIHLISYKESLMNLLKTQQNPKQEMDYSLIPSNETSFPIVQFTRNAQFKVSLSWSPPKIIAGSNTSFSFKMLDPYLINQTAGAISYDFSLIANHNPIFQKSGTTYDSGTNNTINVPIPANATGPITIAFENLNGNSFAGVEFNSIVSNPTYIPEFPFSSLIVLFSIFVVVISFSKLTKFKIYT